MRDAGSRPFGCKHQKESSQQAQRAANGGSIAERNKSQLAEHMRAQYKNSECEISSSAPVQHSSFRGEARPARSLCEPLPRVVQAHLLVTATTALPLRWVAMYDFSSCQFPIPNYSTRRVLLNHLEATASTPIRRQAILQPVVPILDHVDIRTDGDRSKHTSDSIVSRARRQRRHKIEHICIGQPVFRQAEFVHVRLQLRSLARTCPLPRCLFATIRNTVKFPCCSKSSKYTY